MIKKIIICAVIALILVPAGVMAAAPGNQNPGTAPGQGPCLNNGQNCTNQSCVPGSGCQAGYGMQQKGVSGNCGTLNGQCTHDQKCTRSMFRDGSCTAGKRVA